VVNPTRQECDSARKQAKLPATPTCPYCSAAVETDWLACAACGGRLKASIYDLSAPRIKLFGLLVGIVILIGAFAGGYWFLTRTPSEISTPVPVGYGGELKGKTVASPTISQPESNLAEVNDSSQIATATPLANQTEIIERYPTEAVRPRVTPSETAILFPTETVTPLGRALPTVQELPVLAGTPVPWPEFGISPEKCK
jgi:hypothetical protein